MFAKESRKYHQVPRLPKVRAEDPVCLSSSILAIAITLGGGIRVKLVAGKRGKVSCPPEKKQGVVGTVGRLSRVRFDLLCVAIPGYKDVSRFPCCRLSAESNVVGSWRLTEELLLVVVVRKSPFPCSVKASVRHAIPRVALQF